MRVKDKNNGRFIAQSVVGRILDRIVILPNGCHEYTGGLSIWGYGQISIGKHTLHAHRVLYEQLIGPIPEGLMPDHLCRNRACVNLDHLEIVTCQVNLLRSPITLAGINARKEVCIRGHPFDYRDGLGKRVCRKCKNLWYEENGYRKVKK
jgi:hypothetical protein